MEYFLNFFDNLDVGQSLTDKRNEFFEATAFRKTKKLFEITVTNTENGDVALKCDVYSNNGCEIKVINNDFWGIKLLDGNQVNEIQENKYSDIEIGHR